MSTNVDAITFKTSVGQGAETDRIQTASVALEPLIQGGRNWTRWAGSAVSILILTMVAYELRTIDFANLFSLIPAGITFWIVFAAYYFAAPVSEWIIFRRLWALPLEGFGALLRKIVSNEILLGYLGEVYFYAWARRRTRITTAPFGAIKDVAVLSAIMGNVFTLLLVIAASPLFGALQLGMNKRAFVASTFFVLLSSLGALVLRKRLFTLPRRELWVVAAIHAARIVAMLLLAAVMWHMLLPTVALSWWLLLGTFRQLISRLPFLPNKDVVFAGMAAFLVGPDVEIVSAVTLMASLILAAHLVVGGLLGAAELAKPAADR
jgi:hypothetical protein